VRRACPPHASGLTSNVCRLPGCECHVGVDSGAIHCKLRDRARRPVQESVFDADEAVRRPFPDVAVVNPGRAATHDPEVVLQSPAVGSCSKRHPAARGTSQRRLRPDRRLSVRRRRFCSIVRLAGLGCPSNPRRRHPWCLRQPILQLVTSEAVSTHDDFVREVECQIQRQLSPIRSISGFC
jgi:hypothetical protein